MNTKKRRDFGLEFLLGFDGRIHYLEKGYWLKFVIARGEESKERPHGLTYSFTLHAPDGKRLVGFDNAHGVAAPGSRNKRRRAAHDHWHRCENDAGRPYDFKDAETLIEDFFAEVERMLKIKGVSTAVIAEGKVSK